MKVSSQRVIQMKIINAIFYILFALRFWKLVCILFLEYLNSKATFEEFNKHMWLVVTELVQFRRISDMWKLEQNEGKGVGEYMKIEGRSVK